MTRGRNRKNKKKSEESPASNHPAPGVPEQPAAAAAAGAATVADGAAPPAAPSSPVTVGSPAAEPASGVAQTPEEPSGPGQMASTKDDDDSDRESTLTAWKLEIQREHQEVVDDLYDRVYEAQDEAERHQQSAQDLRKLCDKLKADLRQAETDLETEKTRAGRLEVTQGSLTSEVSSLKEENGKLRLRVVAAQADIECMEADDKVLISSCAGRQDPESRLDWIVDLAEQRANIHEVTADAFSATNGKLETVFGEYAEQMGVQVCLDLLVREDGPVTRSIRLFFAQARTVSFSQLEEKTEAKEESQKGGDEEEAEWEDVEEVEKEADVEEKGKKEEGKKEEEMPKEESLGKELQGVWADWESSSENLAKAQPTAPAWPRPILQPKAPSRLRGARQVRREEFPATGADATVVASTGSAPDPVKKETGTQTSPCVLVDASTQTPSSAPVTSAGTQTTTVLSVSASTQTDDLALPVIDAGTQVVPVVVASTATQTDAVVPAESGAQTAAVPPISKGTQTEPLAPISDGVQTVPRPSTPVGIETSPLPLPLATTSPVALWTALPWFFKLLLAMAAIVFALQFLEVRGERALWLAANDSTRRHVLALQDGGSSRSWIDFVFAGFGDLVGLQRGSFI